jgi:hypothetical protein
MIALSVDKTENSRGHMTDPHSFQNRPPSSASGPIQAAPDDLGSECGSVRDQDDGVVRLFLAANFCQSEDCFFEIPKSLKVGGELDGNALLPSSLELLPPRCSSVTLSLVSKQ